MAVTQAYVSDITTHEEKGWIFGTMGGVSGIGMIVGPGVGGYLASGEIGYLGLASPELLSRRSRSSRLRRIFTSLCLKRSDAPIKSNHSVTRSDFCIASKP